MTVSVKTPHPHSALTPDLLAQRLGAHGPQVWTRGTNGRQAGVAIILREGNDGLEVLFIQRSERPGDPWSGHMAFPGGHREPTDADLAATAVRETAEEIGLNLTRDGRLLAVLDQTRAQPRGRSLDLVIGPAAFLLEQPHARISMNYEVADTVWASLDALLDNRYHCVRRFTIRDTTADFNGFLLPGGQFVWGLTYRMLKEFFQVLVPGWTALDQPDDAPDDPPEPAP